MKKYLDIYTDGGYYANLNLVKWAYIVVENDEDIISSDSGNLNGSGSFDVERAESMAIFNALNYCSMYPQNYRLKTDSRSMLDKIENKVPNATKNPLIKGIQEKIKQIKTSPFPCSISLSYCKRRSNKWSREVDNRCQK
jgi:ribonuclease HI